MYWVIFEREEEGRLWVENILCEVIRSFGFS